MLKLRYDSGYVKQHLVFRSVCEQLNIVCASQ